MGESRDVPHRAFERSSSRTEGLCIRFCTAVRLEECLVFDPMKLTSFIDVLLRRPFLFFRNVLLPLSPTLTMLCRGSP